MLDAHVRDRHLDHVKPLSDAPNPLVAADRRKTLSHGLIQRGRRDLDGVGDAVQVLDRDAGQSRPAEAQSLDIKLTNLIQKAEVGGGQSPKGIHNLRQ
jgi:hypothetical protein